MRRLLLTITVFCGIISLYAQSYNQEKVALTNFLVRMYKTEPFEGVKVVSDYDNNYLLGGKLYTGISLQKRLLENVRKCIHEYLPTALYENFRAK